MRCPRVDYSDDIVDHLAVEQVSIIIFRIICLNDEKNVKVMTDFLVSRGGGGTRRERNFPLFINLIFSQIKLFYVSVLLPTCSRSSLLYILLW